AKIVRHTFEVAYFNGSPDGIHKDKILGINGQSPGPTIEADVGDTLEITLINSIQDGQNTTIHWHGIHQKGSIFEDGTSQISQCPLPTGESQLYRFNVTQAGTFWYHSHVNSQYTEGMFGVLLVHGKPEAYQYDGELTIALIPPYPDSGLINGIGRYPCPYAALQKRECNTAFQMRPVFQLQREKTYRLRLLNAGAVAAYNFSIDDHKLRAIEVDGIDVRTPVEANIVPIAAGQRYSFLVRCNNDSFNGSRHLIRANLRKESLMLIDGWNINEYPEALMADVTAVLECVDQDLGLYQHRAVVSREPFTCDDIVPPRPITDDIVYLDEMALSPLDGIPAPDHVDEEFTVASVFFEDHENIRRGAFNYTPFKLPNDKPLLMKLIDGETIPDAYPLKIDIGSVVQLVINNPFFGPHPFHLHGHHFWILGTGEWYDGEYDSSKHNLTLNGVKRDTVVVQEQSWAVIRFIADSPGLWTFHCHIDWHNLSGMALTFVEGVDLIRQMKVPEEAQRVCNLHSRGPNQFTQQDNSTKYISSKHHQVHR
ncbi:L-ascorbate oxidase, partial [Orchesella cincta]